MHRRRVLAAAAALPVGLLAGCLDDDARHYEFDATPATVPADAREEMGYSGEEPESFTLDTDATVAGADVTVTATTWMAQYANQDRSAALFVASTPDATVAGHSLNPLVHGSDSEFLRRLLGEFRDRTDADVDADEFDREEATDVTILGEETEAVTFETEVDVDADLVEESETEAADSVPAYLHLATVSHDDDMVVLVGVHPQAVDERDALLSLMESVEHGSA